MMKKMITKQLPINNLLFTENTLPVRIKTFLQNGNNKVDLLLTLDREELIKVDLNVFLFLLLLYMDGKVRFSCSKICTFSLKRNPHQRMKVQLRQWSIWYADYV